MRVYNLKISTFFLWKYAIYLPYGTVTKDKFYNLIFAPVAQLDRALGYGPGGSGFKS